MPFQNPILGVFKIQLQVVMDCRKSQRHKKRCHSEPDGLALCASVRNPHAVMAVLYCFGTFNVIFSDRIGFVSSVLSW
jgi:hypothetical protein